LSLYSLCTVNASFIRISLQKMSKKGGNPENLHSFKSDSEKPLTETFTVRITPEMKSAIKEQDNPQNFVRQAIQKALDGDLSSLDS
jgi:hypothetical protein